MSTFQIPKIENFKSNSLFGNFYPNFPKSLLILKMSKNKAHICNTHLLNNWNENFQVK